MYNISLRDLKEMIVLIPPLAEQHRIVAKVDQLMSLCDELEAGLMRSQADSERLIRAVVGKMLAGNEAQSCDHPCKL
jgi:type I restriction enzyme S subunit